MIERELYHDGMKLAYGRWDGGSSGATPVVILHGWLEQAVCWDRVARALGRDVIAPDHRGHGRSDWAPAGSHYPFWDYVADVDALIDHVGGPVDLIGHSMGGSMAVLYAAAAPDRVRRLVLVEGVGPNDEGVDQVGLERSRAFLATRRAPPTHRVLPTIDDGIRRTLRANPGVPPDLAERMARRTLREVPGGFVWTWDPRHKTRMPQPFLAAQFRVHLRAIRAPTLVVFGAESPYLSLLPDRSDRVADLADHREIVLSGTGHNPHHDAPDRLASVIHEHLAAP
jgi:pimeloyl-ACP methyl ester carboxylesterase